MLSMPGDGTATATHIGSVCMTAIARVRTQDCHASAIVARLRVESGSACNNNTYNATTTYIYTSDGFRQRESRDQAHAAAVAVCFATDCPVANATFITFACHVILL